MSPEVKLREEEKLIKSDLYYYRNNKLLERSNQQITYSSADHFGK